ncbi:MAG: hypothetical protein LW645_06645 [Verrucomicrobiaceae bacterium]|nr:hypothetical protein [Verrucomicrobiaceae bacterium]
MPLTFQVVSFMGREFYAKTRPDSTAQKWCTGCQDDVGLRIPVTNHEQNLMAHYSLMVDYDTCRWFIPFATVNFWTPLNDGNNIAGLRSNGYDVINFGAGNANGVTQGMVGFGFRSRVHDKVDLGFAYEIAMIRPYGLTNNRVTVDMCIRF